MKNRKLSNYISKISDLKYGRIVVLTGARQTGKTTLAKQLFPDYEYISVEDPVLREQLTKLSAKQWKSLYPVAILDEVQKETQLIETVKSVYDQWEEPKYVLLGSSQLLLLEKVLESLAGRCSIVEIFPLTVPELRTFSWTESILKSIFQEELLNDFSSEYLPSFILDNNLISKQDAWNHYIKLGGYPAVSDINLSYDESYDWLINYVKTYLERDIRDLANFRDLNPFIRLQRYLATNTASLINASSISQSIGISVKTVQRHIKYFEISYQAIVLKSWERNENKRMSKRPKIHYLDNGVIQAVLQKKGALTGSEFESLVVAEIYKQIKNMRSLVELYHLRTYDGKEIDLLLEFQDFYIAFEIKMSNNITKADARHFAGLEEILNKPLKKAIILSNDNETKFFGENIVAVNVNMYLG